MQPHTAHAGHADQELCPKHLIMTKEQCRAHIAYQSLAAPTVQTVARAGILLPALRVRTPVDIEKLLENSRDAWRRLVHLWRQKLASKTRVFWVASYVLSLACEWPNTALKGWRRRLNSVPGHHVFNELRKIGYFRLVTLVTKSPSLFPTAR